MRKYIVGAVKALPVKVPPVEAPTEEAPPVEAPPVEAPPVGLVDTTSAQLQWGHTCCMG